jgi:hypothetical protein
MEHRWDDDEELFADLVEAVRGVGPEPESLAEDARTAFAWRTVDDDLLLAGLTFDSALSGLADGTRAQEPDRASRLLVFSTAAMSVELVVDRDGRLVGQILPPCEARVTLEAATGEPTEVTADDLGFFMLPGIPDDPVRLRCETAAARLVTDWVRL